MSRMKMVLCMQLPLIFIVRSAYAGEYDWITTPDYNAYQGTATYALTESCNGASATGDGLPTCAAAMCQRVATEPTCDLTSSTWDTDTAFQTELSKYSCRTCTQNVVDERCSSTWLKANLLTKHSGLKAAYCNDKYLVIVADGSPGFKNSSFPNLQDIMYPPGGAGNTCRTRTWSKSFMTYKIPLSDQYTLHSTATRYNNLEASTLSTAFPGGADKAYNSYLNDNTRGIYGLPAGGAMAVAISGQDIFPVFADTVELTPSKCEVDGCNEHVGQGGGPPHLHGDPWGANCLYDSTDYKASNGNQDSTVHPPVIGFSFDGPTIYGRYISTAAPGYNTALDDCGGHIHDNYAYHYHSQVKAGKGDAGCSGPTGDSSCEGAEYPAYPPGPSFCWKGKIADVVGFWDKPIDKSEYAQPCCGMTNYFVQSTSSISGQTFFIVPGMGGVSYDVTFVVSLEGVTASQFDAAAQTGFKQVVALNAGAVCGSDAATVCVESDVTITGTTRRGASVTFTMTSSKATTSVALLTSLTTQIASTAFTSALVAKGGNLASVSSVSVTSSTSTGSPAPPPPPPPDDDDTDYALYGGVAAAVVVLILILAFVAYWTWGRGGVRSNPSKLDQDLETAVL